MIAALSAKRLVLVGDHHQLLPFLDERILERAGPHLADQRAVQELWNNSLFKRMWTCAADEVKVLLTTQYQISKVDAGFIMALLSLTGAMIRPIGGLVVLALGRPVRAGPALLSAVAGRY